MSLYCVLLETSTITIPCVCQCTENGQEGPAHPSGVLVGQDMGNNPIFYIPHAFLYEQPLHRAVQLSL